MAEQRQEIVKAEPQEAFSVYIRRPEVMEKFALVLGGNAQAVRYVQNVIVVVETAEPGDYSLQNCSYRSIVRAALRAVTNQVSVDPIDREAYLVPRRVKRMVDGRETKVLEACFQFHYQEIENRAWRTNRYSVINVSPIYEGTVVMENVYTGLHTLVLENGLPVATESAGALRKWNDKDGKKRIGWLGYYRTVRGREATVYMTIEDIEAQVPNRGSFGWKDWREKMERKTVLLALLRKADLKSIEMTAVREALQNIDNAETDDADGGPDLGALETLEGHAEEIPSTKPAAQSAADEAKAQQDFNERVAYDEAGDIVTPAGKRLSEKSDEDLRIIAKRKDASEEIRKAAQIRLDYKAKLAKQDEENLKGIGF